MLQSLSSLRDAVVRTTDVLQERMMPVHSNTYFRSISYATEALTDLDVSDTGAVWQFAFDVTTRNDCRGLAQLLERCPSSRYTCRPRTGATLLHVAANVDAVDCMLLLLRNDASDIDQADSTGATALMVAARNGFIRSLRCLVQLFSAEVNKSDQHGLTSLHWLCTNGRPPDLLQMLLSAKAEPNVQDLQGQTALHLAARNGHATCLHVLIRYGAGVDHIDSKGLSAIDVACKNGQTSALRVLLDLASIDPSLLHRDQDGELFCVRAALLGGFQECLLLILRYLRETTTLDSAWDSMISVVEETDDEPDGGDRSTNVARSRVRRVHAVVEAIAGESDLGLRVVERLVDAASQSARSLLANLENDDAPARAAFLRLLRCIGVCVKRVPAGLTSLEWQGLRVSGLVGLELFVWQPFETLLSRNTSSPLSSTSCRNLCCFIEAYATYTTAVRTLTVHVDDCRRFDAFLSFHKAAVCRMIELEADVLLDHLYFLLENRSFMCWANQVILSQPLERRVSFFYQQLVHHSQAHHAHEGAGEVLHVTRETALTDSCVLLSAFERAEGPHEPKRGMPVVCSRKQLALICP